MSLSYHSRITATSTFLNKNPTSKTKTSKQQKILKCKQQKHGISYHSVTNPWSQTSHFLALSHLLKVRSFGQKKKNSLKFQTHFQTLARNWPRLPNHQKHTNKMFMAVSLNEANQKIWSIFLIKQAVKWAKTWQKQTYLGLLQFLSLKIIHFVQIKWFYEKMVSLCCF